MALTSETGLQERIEVLERQLRTLQDREEIVGTLNQYVRAFDYGADTSVWLDCFLETGVWRSSIDALLSGTRGVRLEGHPELGAWFESIRRHDPEWRQTPRLQSKHIYADVDIRIEDDRATCSSYFFALNNTEAGMSVGSMGRYEDQLVRCEDGRWRFEDRHLCREGAAPWQRDVSAGGFERPGEQPRVGRFV